MAGTAAVGQVAGGGAAGVAAWAGPRAPWLLLAVLCVAAWLVFARTPFLHDLPLMHFIAWRVGAGDMPYADMWDMNGPATYMVHQVMLGLPLTASASVALLMTVLTGACVACVAMIAARGGRSWLGFGIGVALLAWLTGHGPDFLMQRDMMIAGCAVGALALATRPGARMWRWAAAGVLIGLAVGVKPTAAPFGLAAFGGALLIDLGEGRKFRRAMWLVLGGVAGGAVWFEWLVDTGSIGAWWSIMTGYNADYMKIARQPVGALLMEPAVLFALAASVAGSWALRMRLRAGAGREEIAALAMAVTFAAFSAVMYVLQGKGWVYQTAPVVVTGLAAAGMASSSLRTISRGQGWAMAAGVSVVCVLAFGGVREQLSPAYAARQQERVAFVGEMTSALEALPAGMKVQALDTTDGALQAMLEARRAPASPVMYDFMLFTGSDAGKAKARAAVLAAAGKADTAILMTNQGWPDMDTGFARMREFKEFQGMLDQRYTLVSEGRRGRYGYRLFAPAG